MSIEIVTKLITNYAKEVEELEPNTDGYLTKSLILKGKVLAMSDMLNELRK